MMISLKILRIVKRKSQFELALETGIPNYKISRLESGTDQPTAEELRKISEALGVSPTILTTDAEALIGLVVANVNSTVEASRKVRTG